MLIWKIEVFDNKDDPEPSRKGYVSADSEGEAVEAAKDTMGSAMRADVTKVAATNVTTLPLKHVLWED